MPSEAQNLPGTGTSPDAALAAEQVGILATSADGLTIRRIDPATASPEMASVLAKVMTDFQGRLEKVSQNPGAMTIESDEKVTSDTSLRIPAVITEVGAAGIPKELLQIICMSAVDGALVLRQEQGHDRQLLAQFAKVDSAIKEALKRLIHRFPDPISSHEQIALLSLEILRAAMASIFTYVYHGQENFSDKDKRIGAVNDYRIALQVLFQKLQEVFPVELASWKELATQMQSKVELMPKDVQNKMAAYIKENPRYQQEHARAFLIDRSFQVLAQSLFPNDVSPEMCDWYFREMSKNRENIVKQCKKSGVPHLEVIRMAFERNATSMRETAAAFFPGNPLFSDAPRFTAEEPQLPLERETSSPSMTRDQLILLCEELVFSKTANEVRHIPKLWQMEKEKLPEIISVENYDCLQSLTACCYFALPRLQNSSCDSDIAQILNDNNALPSRKLSKEEMDALLDIEIGAKVFFSMLQETLRIPTVSLKDFTEALNQVFQSMKKQFLDKQAPNFQETDEHFDQLKSITDFGNASQEAMPADIDILQARFLISLRVNIERAFCNIFVRSAPELSPQYNKMTAALPNAIDRLLEKFFPGHVTSEISIGITEPEKKLIVSDGYDQLPGASIWTADTTFSNVLPENFGEGLYLIDNLNPTVLEAKIQEIFKTVKEDRSIGETLGIATKPLAIVIPLLSRFRRLAKTVVGEFDGPICTISQYQKIKAGFGFAIQSLTGPHADALKKHISDHFLRPWFADIETRVIAAIPSSQNDVDSQLDEAVPSNVVVPELSKNVTHGKEGVVSVTRSNTTTLLGHREGFSMIRKEKFGLAVRYAFERVALQAEDALALENLFVSAEGEQCFAAYAAFNDRRAELISELRQLVTGEDCVQFSQALRAAFAGFQSALIAADSSLGRRISALYEAAFSHLESSLKVYFSPSS